MNKIETLKKTFSYNGCNYSLALWVTAWDYLCLGYKDVTDLTYKLVSVVIEPDTNNIIEPVRENGFIGQTNTLDDACEMLKKYIDTLNIEDEE